MRSAVLLTCACVCMLSLATTVAGGRFTGTFQPKIGGLGPRPGRQPLTVGGLGLPGASNQTETTIWPQPASLKVDTSTVLSLDPTYFAFIPQGSGGSSDILASGLSRYFNLIFAFPSSAASGQALRDAAALPSLTVDVQHANETLGLATDESYTLNVTEAGATLTAATVFGALHGLETFSQCIVYDMYAQAYTMNPVLVVDAPRFPFRGIMLDVSRHFVSVPSILDVIDLMAYDKMNVLHLHLIDTQSWPIVVPGFPRLSQWGAYANYSHIYTPADIERIVTFAKYRGVRVVPEIDTPSHSDILTAIYPELMTVINCDGGDCPKGDTFLSMPDPTNNATWAFLEAMITEVASMFPDEAFHIGGDEWWPAWNNAPSVEAWMPSQGFTDAVDVYHYYERRVIDIVRGLGKQTYAWEDINGFAQVHWNTSVNSYNDYQDVVLSVWAGWVGNGRNWPQAVEEYISANASVVLSGPWYVDSRSQYVDSQWTDFYNNDPQNFTGSPAQLQRMLGGHVCVWDDAANSDGSNLVQVMYPPTSAAAEVLWSPRAFTTGNPPDSNRMHAHRCLQVQRGFPVPPLAGTGYCLVEYKYPEPVSEVASAPVADSEQSLRELVLALKQDNLRLREELARATA